MHQSLRLERQLSSAEKAKSELQAELTRLSKVLSAEGRDVKQLDGLTLEALFYMILGSLKEQREKEKQEYLQAKLKFDLCRDLLKAEQNKIEELRESYGSSKDHQLRYQSLLKAKEMALTVAENPSLQQITHITEQVTDFRIQEVEIRQAIQAGKSVQDELEKAIAHLNSAKGWGTWDMLGGGLMSTAIKHSRIDDARHAIHRLQQYLREFRNELGDINNNALIQLNIDEFTSFGDYFFDGLIFDWVVQSKIVCSLEVLLELQDKVKTILASLKTEIQGIKFQIEKLSEERERIIVSA